LEGFLDGRINGIDYTARITEIRKWVREEIKKLDN